MTAVITGLGVASPFGLGVDAFRRGLLGNEVAVAPIRAFDASRFPTTIAGEAQRNEMEERDRKVFFCLSAAEEAWQRAGCGDDEREAWLSLALGLESAHLEDFDGGLANGRIQWAREREIRQPRPRLRTPLDAAARRVHERLALRGRFVVHVSACAAGALAVAHAARLIERGVARVVLCGGADSMINPLGIGGMSRLGAPSPRASSDACRPFDRRRDGLVIGEGAAMFVVEDAARARARGADVLAVIAGTGSSQDAYKATAPRPDGSSAAVAMTRALAAARLEPAEIDYINAHGTGTPLGDPAEARAIRLAFAGDADRVPVSSIKGAIGHLMAAAGAVELAASVLAIEEQMAWATTNLEDIDPECALDLVLAAPRPTSIETVMSNSFGFGGQNACCILRRSP